MEGNSEVRRDKQHEASPKHGPWYYAYLQPPWVAAFRLDVQNGRLVVAELHVFATDQLERFEPVVWERRHQQMREANKKLTQAKQTPPGGLTTSLLREQVKMKIPADTLADIAKWLPKSPSRLGGMFTTQQAKALQKEAKRKPGRKARDESFWANLAAAYVSVSAFPNPIQKLHEKMPELSLTQIRDLIHEARSKDFLTYSRRGQVGGELTEKAKQVLRKE